MKTQKGFVYERKVAEYLNSVFKNNDQPHTVITGQNTGDIDLVVKSAENKEDINIELKMYAASAGSLVLKYDTTKNKFVFDELTTNPEKQIIIDLAKKYRILDTINRTWKNKPELSNFLKGKTYPRKEREDAYNEDKKNFKEINGKISALSVEQYYNAKGVYYINVGTCGFFLLGTKDPSKLSRKGDIKRFGIAAKTIWRARVQPKGSGAYQFTLELSFQVPPSRQKYNIGYLDSNNTVTINTSKSTPEVLLR